MRYFCQAARFIASLSNEELQQEIADSEKLQLENLQKIIDLIGIEVWHNSSDNALVTHQNREVKRLKSEDSRLTQIYVWLENELDGRIDRV